MGRSSKTYEFAENENYNLRSVAVSRKTMARHKTQKAVKRQARIQIQQSWMSRDFEHADRYISQQLIGQLSRKAC